MTIQFSLYPARHTDAGSDPDRSRAVGERFSVWKGLWAGGGSAFRTAFAHSIPAFVGKARRQLSDEPILATILGHIELVRVLNRPEMRALRTRHPTLVAKYFGQYLAKNFRLKFRREIMVFHNRYLLERTVRSFFATMVAERTPLWNKTVDGNAYSISLSFRSEYHFEGDLCLTFERNGVILYLITFSIVPGHPIADTADPAFLVACVQGAPEQFEAIRISTRENNDIAPNQMLMAALFALAGPLDIKSVAGVTNRLQLSRKEAEPFPFDYDVFWQSFAARETPCAFYEMSVRNPYKPLLSVKLEHRRRARLRRRYKDQIAASVSRTFAEQFLTLNPTKLPTPAEPPSSRHTL